MLSVFDLFTARPPEWAVAMEHRLNARVDAARNHILNTLETFMAVTQSDLDQIAAGLVDTEGSLQQAIAGLEADIAAGNQLDLSGIRNAASGLAQLVPSTTGGGTPPVSDNPDAPVVDGS